MNYKLYLVGLFILLIVFSVNAQVKPIAPVITLPHVVFTTTSTTTTTFVTCPAGCQCLTEASAESEFKNPEKCVSGICGYYYSSMAAAYFQTPKYCYHEKSTTTTMVRIPVTTTTLPRNLRPVAETGCRTCAGCTQELADGKKNVTLGSDISSTQGTCILFDTDNAILDCRGHKITGYGSGIEFYYGINLRGNGNTIRNCTIEGFEAGISAYGARNNLIKNNTFRRNGDGVWLGGGMINNATMEVDDGSDGNRIEENIITENLNGIYFAGNKNNNLKENKLCRNSEADIYTSPYAKSLGNTKDDDTCDLIYNWNSDSDTTWCENTCTSTDSTSVGSGSGLQGALAGGMFGTITLTGDIGMAGGVSFNASHVKLDCRGHSLRGGGNGTGITIRDKVNVELRNCTIDNYGTGVLLDSVSHSRIISNTIKNNGYGLMLRSGEMSSRSNNISKNTIKPNDLYGIYLDGDTWGNTLSENNILGGQYSLYTNARCDNTIADTNKGSGNKKIGYYHDASGLSIAYPTDRRFGELILCNVRDSTFSGVEVDNTGIKADGIIIKDSQNVEFTNPSVKQAYNGIAVINSSSIQLASSQIIDAKKDCISAEKSSGTKIKNSRLSGCYNGVYIGLSTGTEVTDSEINEYNLSGVHAYMSDSSLIEDNKIIGKGTTVSGRGIWLEEGSENNLIHGNTINETSVGIMMESASTHNTLENNLVCGNTNDIYNQAGNNSGDENTCSVPMYWDDEGTAACTHCCSPASHDINNDGTDNSCDCYDAYQGYGEEGTDCGGKCGACVECTWCGSDVGPLRIKGRPNDNMIDIVFVPHESFRNNMSLYVTDAYDHVRNYYLKLDKLTNDSIPRDYKDRFNFYFYKDGFGYDGQCSGELPGEEDYRDWLIGCSVACGASLGLACGCFAYEPDHFYGDAGWADVAGILTMNSAGCANTLGPQSHYIAERAGPVVIHESGHALFGLVDEYCGDTYYTQPGSHPNVWSSLSGCQSYASSHGWSLGNCRQIKDINASGAVTCSKGYYRYDPDAPTESYMIVWGSSWTYKFWEAAGERINAVFDNYPGGGSRGVLIYVKQNDSGMSKVGVTVVSGHPDQGLQEPVYWTEVLSAGKSRLDEFGLWDYRRPLADGPGSKAELLSQVTFPLNIPFEGNIRWVNIYNATSGELVLSMDIGPELYGWCRFSNWSGEDCKKLDVDNNGVADWTETDSWNPVQRIQNLSFGDRLDIPEEIRRITEAENTPSPKKGGGNGGIGGLDMNLALGGGIIIIGLLLVVVILLAVIFIMMLKKRK
jgi:parallel beta-helix repeat protein